MCLSKVLYSRACAPDDQQSVNFDHIPLQHYLQMLTMSVKTKTTLSLKVRSHCDVQTPISSNLEASSKPSHISDDLRLCGFFTCPILAECSEAEMRDSRLQE